MPDLLETYLTGLRRALAARGITDARVLEEARTHLGEDVDAAVARGASREVAARDAIARFGAADEVAQACAANGPTVLDWSIGALAFLTMIAMLLLTASALLLRPARLNVPLWFGYMIICLFQGLITLDMLRVQRPFSWRRPVMLVGAVVIMSVGGFGAYRTLVGAHFEGYALVLGSLLTVQGALTLLRYARPAASSLCLNR